MFSIQAHLDREAAERVRSRRNIQVASLEDDEGNDLTYLVDQGQHFHTLEELKTAILRSIAERLTVDEV